jgi:ABC-type Fe3+ transport system permease subunit
MTGHTDSPSPPVPGPLGRAVSGIVVRDGRFYWSAFAMWWRITLLYFALKFLMRLAVLRSRWPEEPELWGVPGLSMPIAGDAAFTAPFIALILVLISYRQRRRFNAAAHRVDAAAH